jgi:rod shape determining protein RodA
VASIDRRAFQHFDWLLFALVWAVVAIGLANLFSATHAGAEGRLPAEFRRQLAAVALGASAMIVVLLIDYRRLERWAPALYVAALLLTASTLVLAPVTRGNRSWLVYGPLSLQPAEFAKIGLVLMLARYFQRHPPGRIHRLRDLFGPGLILAGPVGLILLQHDLGVALLTLLIGATYLLFVRIPAKAWAVVGAAALAALAGLWSFAFKDYQRRRILDFLDPTRDPLASGYQAIQSRIAVGSGGLTGQGYLEGPQTQLQFLPTQHSDFAFSVLAEEWGFIGCTVLLMLYLSVLVWGLVVASNSKDSFGSMLAIGVVGILFWPALINVAMVLGLAPVIGVPLPLISYGGTQVLANLIALALLMNVSMRRYIF